MNNKTPGNRAFAVVCISLVFVLLISIGFLCYKVLIYKFDVPTKAVVSNSVVPPTAKIESAISPTPRPTPIVTEEDRIMPELDGELIPFVAEQVNQIPVIFDMVKSSVVSVKNYQNQTIGSGSFTEIAATGTGFVVSSDGYILTNAHVLEDAVYLTVCMNNGEEYDVKVIGSDADTDIAVLKIDVKELQPIVIGNSDSVRVGDFVLAIGNPIDSQRLANTLTYGIISAKNRFITIDGRTNEYLQTDAAINYGNSGGPLLNMSGEVIGINSAKTVVAGYDTRGNSISAEGIGFAIPINEAVRVMQLLVEKGSIERPAIGITVTTLTDADAAYYGMSAGISVQSVVKDSPADRAGIKVGDVILRADGLEFKDHSELVVYLAGLKIGDSVAFVVLRDGVEMVFHLTLEDKSKFEYSID